MSRLPCACTVTGFNPNCACWPISPYAAAAGQDVARIRRDPTTIEQCLSRAADLRRKGQELVRELSDLEAALYAITQGTR